MIIGIGLDILETGRMRRMARSRAFLERFLHPSELEEFDGEGAHETGPSPGIGGERPGENLAMLYASRFAAKEAFGKALGTGLRGLSLRDIAVAHDKLGRPFFFLYGSAREALERAGGTAVHLSISHQESIVAAVVVIEREIGRGV